MEPGIKQQLHRLGSPLQMFGYKTGLMQLSARFRGAGGAIILMYHSVADDSRSQWIDPRNHVPADIFEKQILFLAKHRKVVALGDLVDMLKQDKKPENGTVVITFDDGYHDNFAIAAPILDRYGLTATLFLPTGYIDRGETQWVDQAYTAFRFRTSQELVWGEGASAMFNLDDPDQYAAGYHAVCMSLISASAVQRRSWLKDLTRQLQPAKCPPRLTMTWADVQALLTRYGCFEIGGHTVEHTDLTNISEEEAQKELVGCAQSIKKKLGVRPRFFSFCYGRTSKTLRRIAAEAGFEAACGGDGLDPVIGSSDDLFCLPRVAAPSLMNRFDLLTSWANTGIWRRLGR